MLVTIAVGELAEKKANDRLAEAEAEAAAEAAKEAEREHSMLRTQAELGMTKKHFVRVRSCMAAQEGLDAAAAGLTAQKLVRAQAVWRFLAGKQQAQRCGRDIQ
eukprot:jgi/Ulvmu1/8422/UM042_0129.1